MFGPGLVCDRFQFIQPLPDFVGHHLLGQSHLVVDQRDGGAQLWMHVVDGALVPESSVKAEVANRLHPVVRLRHPSLVRAQVLERDDERIYLGYEALPGALVIDDLLQRYGASAPPVVLDRARAVARGLDALHRRGVVHGGLDGRSVVAWEEQCLLWGYGILPVLPADRLRDMMRATEGLLNLAPEVKRGEFTPAGDVYAWGVLVAQLLTGEGPTTAMAAAVEVAPSLDLAESFMSLLSECTAEDPRDRPQDGTALLARLEAMTEITASQDDTPSADLELPVPPDAGLGAPPVSGADATPSGDDDGMISMSNLSMDAEPEASESVPDLTELVSLAEPAPTKKRVGEPTAKLATLAAEIVGDDGVEEMASVFEGVAPGKSEAGTSSIDLEKLALGVEAAATSSEGLALIGGGDAADGFDTFATRTAPIPEEEMDAPVEVDRAPKKIRVKRPPRQRRPGPHGPPPNFMSRGFVVFSGAITFLFTLHVAGARGGYPALIDAKFGAEVAQEMASAVDQAREMAGATAPAATGSGEASPSTTEGQDNPGTGGTGGTRETDASAATDGGAETGGETGGAPIPQALDIHVPRPCPQGTVVVDERVCIDAAEYPGFRRVPKVNVTFEEAAAMCEERGARLCDQEEWRAACAGPDNLRYPYGNRVNATACNTASIAGYAQNRGASGSMRQCVTAAGVYDMVGNVGEWVSNGRAVGGDSTTSHKSVDCRAAGVPPRGFKGDTLGFRCCVDR